MLRKTAIVTGASSGIGRETALFFARNGYNIVLAEHINSTKNVEDEIKEIGVDAISIGFDLESEEKIVNFFNCAFEKFEYIDCIVNCAGIALKQKLFIDVTCEEIDKILDVNLRGTMLACREGLKHLVSQKHGNIVNISSILGETGGSFETVYSTSKGGIISLTKSLAVEFAPFGLRINTVAPGFVETNMTENLNEEARADCISQIPLSRLGKPSDIASIIYFLAQDSASYITGQCIGVNGGAIRFD